MGRVINSVQSDNKITYTLLIDIKDIRNLHGNLKKIFIFSTDCCNISTKVIERGNHNGTKYFLIPKKLKTKNKNKSCKIFYQKIDIDDKIIFVYDVKHK
jgi:hypothetical protein